MTVGTSIHHLSSLRHRPRPIMKRNMVTAPIYMGPAVKGWGPQYIGRAFATAFRLVWPALRSRSMVADLSGFTEYDDEPPL